MSTYGFNFSQLNSLVLSFFFERADTQSLTTNTIELKFGVLFGLSL